MCSILVFLGICIGCMVAFGGWGILVIPVILLFFGRAIFPRGWNNSLRNRFIRKRLNIDECKEVLSILLQMHMLQKNVATTEDFKKTVLSLDGEELSAYLERDEKNMKESNRLLYRLSELTGKSEKELVGNPFQVLNEQLEPYKNTAEYIEWSEKIKQI